MYERRQSLGNEENECLQSERFCAPQSLVNMEYRINRALLYLFIMFDCTWEYRIRKSVDRVGGTKEKKKKEKSPNTRLQIVKWRPPITTKKRRRRARKNRDVEHEQLLVANATSIGANRDWFS